MKEIKYSCSNCGRVRFTRVNHDTTCFAIICTFCIQEGTDLFHCFRVTLDPIMCLVCNKDCRKSVVGEVSFDFTEQVHEHGI